MASITLWVNGEKMTAHGVLPQQMLAGFLRERGLTGTKVSCGQGGCGACTVVIAQPGHAEVSINACIRPLLLCDGCAVLTTEGIGRPDAPHPVQQRIAQCNGSQCGFCTPGQVMSMYGLLRQCGPRQPTPEEVEAALDGNLCRCTGYRSIHAAFYGLSSRDDSTTNVTGMPPVPLVRRNDPEPPAEQRSLPGCREPMKLSSADGSIQWSRVRSVAEWQTVSMTSSRRVQPVVGMTTNGLFGVKTGAAVYCDVSNIPELRRCEMQEDGLVVGGALTITELIKVLRENASSSQSYAVLADSYSHIANTGVRNAGGWAGNLCLGRVLFFPSDGAPMLAAARAVLTIARPDGSTERVSAFDFASTGFDAERPFLIVSMRLPRFGQHEFLHCFRHALRPVNAHATVCASFRATLRDDNTVASAEAFFSGVARRTVRVDAAVLVGAVPGRRGEPFSRFVKAVLSVPLETDGTHTTQFRPQGDDAHRPRLAEGFALKWWTSLNPRTAEAETVARSALPPVAQLLRSEARLPLPDNHPGRRYVGPKVESLEQACGVTQYTADLGMGPRGLHGAFVTATRAGKLQAVDPTRALQAGAFDFVGPKDVPGMNSCSLVPEEEPLFAAPGSMLPYNGAPVGLIVADTAERAQQLARMVQVKVVDGDTPPIYTIADAVARKSFLNGAPPKKFSTGDCDAAFAQAGVRIIEGDLTISGQNNFYMEKQGALAAPEDMGRIVIYGGCQCPDMTKKYVMIALGCSSDKVTLKNRPMGGAFGGKFTKQYPAYCSAAVACRKLRRPVRVVQNIHTDMGFSGNTRHVGTVHYKVAATPEGKILALDTDIVVDAGCGNDYTDYIADEILKRQDFAYDVPNYRSQVAMVKTNNPSATAVRAPGLMQACVISETIMDAISQELGLSGEQVREASLKRRLPRDMTGQDIPEWNMPELWEQLKRETEFEKRQAAADAFNRCHQHKKRALSLMPLKYAVGYINMSGATVTINVNAVDGSVAVQTGCCEMGQGCLTKVLSVVSAELGVAFEKVSGYYPDTSVIPNLSTDGGSAGAEMLCSAARQACIDLRAKLEPVRVQLLKEKEARKEKPEAAWEEVVARAYGPMPSDTRMLLSATAQFNAPGWHGLMPHALDAKFPGVPYWNWEPAPKDLWQYYVTGAACSEVEVDVLTGEACVLRSDVLLDAGNSISPLIDLGQAEGGFAYGVGSFLREEILMDPKTGRNKSDGTWEYKVPSNKCVPRVFNVRLVPGNPCAKTHYGSKGAGEPPMLLAYSAVSAIRKAIAVSRKDRGLSRVFRLDSPATSARISDALELKGTAGETPSCL
eukprot:TRINITY_DN46804_c0_g1_i1.p1 TRINITY_DN46804_c0_g1~~TRINITY_DN46804_c0_g1_i1.p1  ORF type:complete len:1341 (+),score=410.78 TRINITY_DN46804_c0_g1_i1:79-4023(+)